MRIAVIGNTTKAGLRDVFRILLDYFTRHSLTYRVHEDLGRWYNTGAPERRIDPLLFVPETALASSADIIVALGGDGTMLAAARQYGPSGTPLLGVNLGKLGFLAEISIEEIESCFDQLVSGRTLIVDRTVLEATCEQDGRRFYGLNEIVIDRGASPRLINLATYVDDDYLVTYAGDGIILATPTGTTAYSLSNGGPIAVPSGKVIVINPIAPHTLTARSVVVDDASVIKVSVESVLESVHINADGQVEGFYKTPAEFIIRKAPYTIKLVKLADRTYYDILRAKLFWGSDIRVGEKG